jgi:hypothetical protein
VREILEVRRGMGVFSDELYKDAMERVGLEQDGIQIARGFLQFLLE